MTAELHWALGTPKKRTDPEAGSGQGAAAWVAQGRQPPAHAGLRSIRPAALVSNPGSLHPARGGDGVPLHTASASPPGLQEGGAGLRALAARRSRVLPPPRRCLHGCPAASRPLRPAFLGQRRAQLAWWRQQIRRAGAGWGGLAAERSGPKARAEDRGPGAGPAEEAAGGRNWRGSGGGGANSPRGGRGA